MYLMNFNDNDKTLATELKCCADQLFHDFVVCYSGSLQFVEMHSTSMMV